MVDVDKLLTKLDLRCQASGLGYIDRDELIALISAIIRRTE